MLNNRFGFSNGMLNTDPQAFLDLNIMYRIFFKNKHDSVKNSTKKTELLRKEVSEFCRKVYTFSTIGNVICVIGFIAGFLSFSSSSLFDFRFPLGAIIPFFLNIVFLFVNMSARHLSMGSKYILSDEEAKENSENMEDMFNPNPKPKKKYIECEYCKSKIEADSKFCESCGAKNLKL